MNGLPALVLARLGAEDAAVYGIVWTIAHLALPDPVRDGPVDDRPHGGRPGTGGRGPACDGPPVARAGRAGGGGAVGGRVPGAVAVRRALRAGGRLGAGAGGAVGDPAGGHGRDGGAGARAAADAGAGAGARFAGGGGAGRGVAADAGAGDHGCGAGVAGGAVGGRGGPAARTRATPVLPRRVADPRVLRFSTRVLRPCTASPASVHGEFCVSARDSRSARELRVSARWSAASGGAGRRRTAGPAPVPRAHRGPPAGSCRAAVRPVRAGAACGSSAGPAAATPSCADGAARRSGPAPGRTSAGPAPSTSAPSAAASSNGLAAALPEVGGHRVGGVAEQGGPPDGEGGQRFDEPDRLGDVHRRRIGGGEQRADAWGASRRGGPATQPGARPDRRERRR